MKNLTDCIGLKLSFPVNGKLLEVTSGFVLCRDAVGQPGEEVLLPSDIPPGEIYWLVQR